MSLPLLLAVSTRARCGSGYHYWLSYVLNMLVNVYMVARMALKLGAGCRTLSTDDSTVIVMTSLFLLSTKVDNTPKPLKLR
jgi:hypothetical protein